MNRAEREGFVRQALADSAHKRAWVERHVQEIVDRWESDVSDERGEAFENGMIAEREVHFW